MTGHMYRMAMLSFLFTSGDRGCGSTPQSGSGVESERGRDARPSSDTSHDSAGNKAERGAVDRDRYIGLQLPAQLACHQLGHVDMVAGHTLCTCTQL